MDHAVERKQGAAKSRMLQWPGAESTDDAATTSPTWSCRRWCLFENGQSCRRFSIPPPVKAELSEMVLLLMVSVAAVVYTSAVVRRDVATGHRQLGSSSPWCWGQQKTRARRPCPAHPQQSRRLRSPAKRRWWRCLMASVKVVRLMSALNWIVKTQGDAAVATALKAVIAALSSVSLLTVVVPPQEADAGSAGLAKTSSTPMRSATSTLPTEAVDDRRCVRFDMVALLVC